MRLRITTPLAVVIEEDGSARAARRRRDRRLRDIAWACGLSDQSLDLCGEMDGR